MRIYLASSWRNKAKVHEVGDLLREHGHYVFDFTRPPEGSDLPNGFHWSEIDPNWQKWTPHQYRTHLRGHGVCQVGLEQDRQGMRWAQCCVAIQPFGRSASLELGWFIGSGRETHILLDGGEPELMFGMADHLHIDTEELIEALVDEIPF